MRATCTQCRKRNGPLYAIRRALDGVRVAQPANDRTKRPRCMDCAMRTIERRDKLDRMSPEAVAFVLANGGKL